MKRLRHVLVCGSAFLGAMLCGSNMAQGEPPIRDKIPLLSHAIVYQTEFCTYADTKPFVKQVNWNHPLIKAAEAGIKGISRCTMSYGDHIAIYELDKDNEWGAQAGLYNYWTNKQGVTEAQRQAQLNAVDAKVARANYENFVKTLLGEYRDYPYMVKRKLESVVRHTPVNKSGAQGQAADQAYLFDSLTGEGYARLRYVLSAVFTARQNKLNPNPSRFNYGWNEVGHTCNRTDNSVKAFTHGEMRYIFSEWLAGAPKAFNIDAYEAGLQKFLAEKCNPSPTGPDLGYSYDFRGDKNYKANWFECNSFIWLSRDAARVALAQIASNSLDPAYYQRPFAMRLAKSKELLGSYLFYPGEHQQYMRQASESGGGPQVYFDNADTNNDGLADYRLFPDVMGSGDIGLESQALPSERVAAGEVTRKAIPTFQASTFRRYKDWGFNSFLTVTDANRAHFAQDRVFSASDSNEAATFKLKMARLNAALDRHTNWGPTHMFSPLAYRIAKRYAVRGAYSPFVAMSYEISKSHNFAVGDFPATHPKDRGKVKTMFIVKFPTKNYYDERSLRANKSIDWNVAYLNEPALSNDYYNERALNKFGWIPANDISTSCYLAESDADEPYYPPTTGSPGIVDHFDNQ